MATQYFKKSALVFDDELRKGVMIQLYIWDKTTEEKKM